LCGSLKAAHLGEGKAVAREGFGDGGFEKIHPQASARESRYCD